MARHAHDKPITMTAQGRRTLAGPGDETLIVKKSRFIGHAAPVSDEAAALAMIVRISKAHWEANHNCYACLVGPHDEVQRSSDAGEPSGTAGRPILETLKREGVHDACVVVTRYFGGILLGTGGLTRAYGQAASAAIQAAGQVELIPHRRLSIIIPYSLVGLIQRDLETNKQRIEGTDFGTNVTVQAIIALPDMAITARRIIDLTSGVAQITWGAEITVSVAIS